MNGLPDVRKASFRLNTLVLSDVNKVDDACTQKQLCQVQVDWQCARVQCTVLISVKIWVKNMHLGCLALCRSCSLFQSDTLHLL